MFYPLKVNQINKETSNAVSIIFEVPSDLSGMFSFLSGQFLTLKHNINGKEVRRSYSLCSMPRSQEIKIAIKKIPDGVFSSFAVDTLKVGDFIDVAVPAGKFVVKCQSNHQRKYVFVAVGSGITPIISMIKTILNDEPLSTVHLLYGNKTKSETIFGEELDVLENKYAKRLSLKYFFTNEDTGSSITNGRINVDKITNVQSEWGDLKQVFGYYLCGPQTMVEEVNSYLQQKEGVPADNVHFELFTSVVAENTTLVSGDEIFEKSKVTATIRGVDYTFEVKPGQNVLAAALSARIEMPYSCQGGVCGSCECKVTEGRVELNQNMILSDDEVDSGQSLACQAVPKTKEVRLSFDF